MKYTSYTREVTAHFYRAQKRAGANMSLRDCLTATVRTIGDDRALAQDAKEWRGNGNRLKRRLGWELRAWSCYHMRDGYDCCCEPQGGYYYEQP